MIHTNFSSSLSDVTIVVIVFIRNPKKRAVSSDARRRRRLTRHQTTSLERTQRAHVVFAHVIHALARSSERRRHFECTPSFTIDARQRASRKRHARIQRPGCCRRPSRSHIHPRHRARQSTIPPIHHSTPCDNPKILPTRALERLSVGVSRRNDDVVLSSARRFIRSNRYSSNDHPRPAARVFTQCHHIHRTVTIHARRVRGDIAAPFRMRIKRAQRQRRRSGVRRLDARAPPLRRISRAPHRHRPVALLYEQNTPICTVIVHVCARARGDLGADDARDGARRRRRLAVKPNVRGFHRHRRRIRAANTR